MHPSRKIFLVSDEIRAVKAVYDPDDPKNQPGTFKTFDKELKVGDLVIVESTTRHHMTTVEIVEVDVEPDLDTHREMLWVVDKINTAAFEELKVQEADFLEKIRRAEKKAQRDELRAKMLASHEQDIQGLAIVNYKTTSGQSSLIDEDGSADTVADDPVI